MTYRSSAGILAITILACIPETALSANVLLDRATERVAKAIATYLAENEIEHSVSVGAIAAHPRLKTSGGIEIRRSLIEQLSDAGIKNTETASTQVMGTYDLIFKKQHDDDRFPSPGVSMTCVLVDGKGNVVRMPIDVFGSPAYDFSGHTLDLPVTLDLAARYATMQKQIQSPLTVSVGAETRSSSASPYGVEIQVREGDRFVSRVPTIDSTGQSFVRLGYGQEYRIVLRNHSSFGASVKVLIDGVDYHAGADDGHTKGSAIVYPRRPRVVSGWYRSTSEQKAFEVGDYEDSVAYRQGVSGSEVGTITALFRASWAPGSPRPHDEPGGNSKAGVATTEGRDLSIKTRWVDRRSGMTRSVITIRYDKGPSVE